MFKYIMLYIMFKYGMLCYKNVNKKLWANQINLGFKLKCKKRKF